MWFRLRRRPVAKTNVTCMTMKNRNQHRTRKCSDRAVWIDSRLLTRLKRVESAGDMPRPVISASGAAMNTVRKYASNCRPLYAVHPCSVGQCNDRYWINTEAAEGNTFHVVG